MRTTIPGRVRTGFGLTPLLICAACRGPSPAAPTAKTAIVAPAPAPKPKEPEPLPASVGSLERPAALVGLFASLAKLEAKTATDDVRITQFGDSHTAADWQTGPMRRALQSRFGDGGRGFVPVGRPWKAWSQDDVLTGNAGEWTTLMNNPTVRHPTGDGVFGLSGIAMASRQPGARAWIDVDEDEDRGELAYLEQPGGGSFDLVVDFTTSRITTRAEQKRSAFRAIPMGDPHRHHVEVRPIGDGEVRIFGIALDRLQYGLVFDAFGINGARIATAAWNEAAWTEDLRHRAPSLVILAYGTNDAVDVETSLDAFEAGFAETLARIERALPETSCLVLGPPDRGNAPRLADTIARERHAAETAKCAFYDQVAAMGGPGAMTRWAKEAYPRGQPDHVHLTRTGYTELGRTFVADLLKAYDLWRARRPG